MVITMQKMDKSCSSSSSSRSRPRQPTCYVSSFNPFATVEREENFPDFEQAIAIRTTNDSFVDENNRSTASNGSNANSMFSISVRAALAEHNRQIAVHGIDPDISSLQASEEEKAVCHQPSPSRDPRDVEWERILNSSRVSSAGSVSLHHNSETEQIYAEGNTIEVSTNVSDFFNSSQVVLLATPEHSRNVNYAEAPTRRNECYLENSFMAAASDDDTEEEDGDESHHRMRHIVRLATTTSTSETSNHQADTSGEAFANVDLSRISADGSCHLESPLRHNESMHSHDPLEFTSTVESPKRKKDRLQPYIIGTTASSSPFSSPSRGSRLASPRTKLHNNNNNNYYNSNRSSNSNHKWKHQTTTPPRQRQVSRPNHNSPPSLFENDKTSSDSAIVGPEDVHLGQLGLSPISKKAADSARLMLQTDNWKQVKQSSSSREAAAATQKQSFPDESLSFEHGPVHHDKNSFSGHPFSSNVLEQTDHSRQQTQHTQLACDSISQLHSSSSEPHHSKSTESSDLKKTSLSSISPNSSSEHHVTTKKSGRESSSLSKFTQSSGKKSSSSPSWNDAVTQTSATGNKNTKNRPSRSDNSINIHGSSSSSVHSAFETTDRRRFRTVVPMRAYMTEPSEFPLEDDSFSTTATSFSIPNFSTPSTGTEQFRQEMPPHRQWTNNIEHSNISNERECHSAPARTSTRRTNETDVFVMSPVLRERLFLHQSR